MLGHGARLVVTSQHDDVSWVVQLKKKPGQRSAGEQTGLATYLETEEEDADLEGEDASVNVVTQEK